MPYLGLSVSPQSIGYQAPYSVPNPPFQNFRRSPIEIEKHTRYLATNPNDVVPSSRIAPPLPGKPQVHERPVVRVFNAPLPYVPPPPLDDPHNTPHPLQRYFRPAPFASRFDEKAPVSTLPADQISRPAVTTRPDRPWYGLEPILSSFIESNEQPAPYPQLPLNESAGGGGEGGGGGA
jgi:hypothetical protein